MAKYRFYLDPTDLDPANLTLTGDEAHHCADVMRCKPGEQVILFDGKGLEIEAEIVTASRKRVELKPISETRTNPLPALISLGQAIPKGKNMELIIQKATELGVSRIVPLLSERTVVQLDGKALEKKREKWQRIAIEACKQCGQNWLPVIETPVSVKSFVENSSTPLKIVAAISPEAKSLKSVMAEFRASVETSPNAASLLVGPEGDFTPTEIETALDGGFHPITLGPIILRSETAAIYTLSIVGYELM